MAPVDGALVGNPSLVYLCGSQSREDGTFSFPCLPSGEYTVVRIYCRQPLYYLIMHTYIEFHREIKYGFLLSEDIDKSWEEKNNKTPLYIDSTKIAVSFWSFVSSFKYFLNNAKKLIYGILLCFCFLFLNYWNLTCLKYVLINLRWYKMIPYTSGPEREMSYLFYIIFMVWPFS